MAIEFTTTERIFVMSGLRSQLNDARHTLSCAVTGWGKRAAERDVETLEAALAKFDAELEAAANSLIGRECTFSFEPYHGGSGIIESLERRNSPNTKDDTYWNIVIKVTSGTTASRLMGQSSVSPIAYKHMDCPVSQYCVLDWARSEDTPFVRYVYPCG